MLNNKQQICFLTSNEIAAKLNVSASTVVRLSGKLGFDSFAALKKAFQKAQSSKEAATLLPTIPYEKIKQYEKLTDLELISALRQNILFNINKDITDKSTAAFVDAADMITRAKRVFIVGFRTCSGFASSFAIMLSCIRPGVLCIGDHQPIVDSLIDLNADDIIIAISFKRYSSDTSFAVKMAADAGCKVIAMTDSYTAPITQDAAAVLVSSMENMSFFNSYTSFVMNMETIIALVSKRNRQLNEARLRKMESYLEKTGQY